MDQNRLHYLQNYESMQRTIELKKDIENQQNICLALKKEPGKSFVALGRYTTGNQREIEQRAEM